MPFAFQRRLDKGEPRSQILLHVLVRTASLMIIGLCMGNMRGGRAHMDPIGMSKHLWTVLLLASFIIVWNSYPKAEGLTRALCIGLRFSGMALLIYLVTQTDRSYAARSFSKRRNTGRS